MKSLKIQAIPLSEIAEKYTDVLNFIGDADIILLGEATHGSHEFYTMRAEITQRLISENRCHAVLIEGDWPDAHEINAYVHGKKYKNAQDALAVFNRFPSWMWRNVPISQFIEWLKTHNDQKEHDKKVDFYGLDVYSLYRSIDVIINYLDDVNPAAAQEARHYYACIEQYRHNPEKYGYDLLRNTIKSCADDIIEELKRLQEQTGEYLERGALSADEAFDITQNARVIKNAEEYYRALFISDQSNWNLRDTHMFDTLLSLREQYQLKGIKNPKIVIWAHNSHIGNALATQMGDAGEFTIGQLVKEEFGNRAVAIGFTTYQGTVSAAHDWHGPVERFEVQKALPESYEALFHTLQISRFFLPLRQVDLHDRLLERAIGVVYRPETERASHYFYANIKEQFDAVIHCDATTALEPLEKSSRWRTEEAPETYPSGL